MAAGGVRVGKDRSLENLSWMEPAGMPVHTRDHGASAYLSGKWVKGDLLENGQGLVFTMSPWEI